MRNFAVIALALALNVSSYAGTVALPGFEQTIEVIDRHLAENALLSNRQITLRAPKGAFFDDFRESVPPSRQFAIREASGTLHLPDGQRLGFRHAEVVFLESGAVYIVQGGAYSNPLSVRTNFGPFTCLDVRHDPVVLFFHPNGRVKTCLPDRKFQAKTPNGEIVTCGNDFPIDLFPSGNVKRCVLENYEWVYFKDAPNYRRRPVRR